jgi:hypothetical protein
MPASTVPVMELIGDDKDLSAAFVRLQKHAAAADDRILKLEATSTRGGKRGAESFAHMAAEAGKFALALAGVGSVESIFHKVVEMARKSIEEMRKLQRDALSTQQTFSDNLGRFVSNNPTLPQNEVDKWKRFALLQGETGVSGGAAGVMYALSDLRGSTAGSSDVDQMAAMGEAVKRRQLDPSTDLAKYSQAVLKIKDDLGVGITEASNVLSIYGERAGGDIAGLAGQVGRLKGLSGVSGGNIKDALALHAFLTTETGDSTGEDSTTTVSNLIARAATRDVELGGKKVRLKGETGLDRVLETIDRINSGEFGDPKDALAAYTRELGRESASAVIALGSLRVAGGKFAETRKLIEAGAAPGADLTAQGLATKAALTPAFDAMKGAKEGEGSADAAAQGNVGGASMAAADLTLEAFDKEFGTGAAGTLDISRFPRRLYADFFTGSKQFTAQEKMRRARDKVRGLLPGQGGPVPTPETVEALNAIGRSKTPEEVYAVGARYGAVDSETRLSPAEQKMLLSAGAAPKKVAELEKSFEDGMKDAFKQGVSELIMELRQNKTTPRQETD